MTKDANKAVVPIKKQTVHCELVSPKSYALDLPHFVSSFLSELAFQNHTLDTATKNLIFGTEFFLRLRSDDDGGVMVMMMSMVSSGECWHRRAQQQDAGQYGEHCFFQCIPPGERF